MDIKLLATDDEASALASIEMLHDYTHTLRRRSAETPFLSVRDGRGIAAGLWTQLNRAWNALFLANQA